MKVEQLTMQIDMLNTNLLAIQQQQLDNNILLHHILDKVDSPHTTLLPAPKLPMSQLSTMLLDASAQPMAFEKMFFELLEKFPTLNG